MRLRQYINQPIIYESRKKVSLNKMKEILAREEKTKAKFIKFIGKTEEPMINKVQFWFNLMDPDHPRYKSTMMYSYPMNA